jgi:DNA-binding HxlR family transcriptional regulator
MDVHVMQRTSFLSYGCVERTSCPAARALESVGDWWSILILRDAFQGLSKFDEFEKNLGISANILARRLKHLTAEGLFERQRYNDHPPRFEYVLTDKGRDFYPVAIALFAWGNRNLAPNEIAMRLGDKKTGGRGPPLSSTRILEKKSLLKTPFFWQAPPQQRKRCAS